MRRRSANQRQPSYDFICGFRFAPSYDFICGFRFAPSCDLISSFSSTPQLRPHQQLQLYPSYDFICGFRFAPATTSSVAPALPRYDLWLPRLLWGFQSLAPTDAARAKHRKAQPQWCNDRNPPAR